MTITSHRGSRREAWRAAILLTAFPAVAAPDQSTLEAALHYFTRHDPAGIAARLESDHPAPVSPAEREGILANLPPEGHVRELDATQRRKLAAARRILELHGRQAVYEVRVIEVPQAAVALHARSVVLVSEAALDLLDPEELQALVAHEVGHERFWSEYSRARRDGDRRRLQTLELLCDGLAIVTLRRAGTDPARLTSALERVVRYNRDRFGAALNEDDYPAMAERRRFARRLSEWLAGASVAPPAPAPRVGVSWFTVDLQPSCTLDVQGVQREVRRIFAAMGVEIDWKVSATEAIRGGGEEITVVALPTDSPKGARVMGATIPGLRSVWVYCPAIARALDVDPGTTGSAPLLSQAVGRVVAHEMVHVLTTALPHSSQGLMAASWEPKMLVEPVLDADSATRLAIQGRLAGK